jgi:hypothetical protein
VERAEHAGQFVDGESGVFANLPDGDGEPALQVLEIGIDRLAVADASLLGDVGDLPWRVHDGSIEVDHRSQLRHRGGQVDERPGHHHQRYLHPDRRTVTDAGALLSKHLSVSTNRPRLRAV